jgi:hypothetical protein
MRALALLSFLALGPAPSRAGCSDLPPGYAPPFPGCVCLDSDERRRGGQIRDSRWVCPARGAAAGPAHAPARSGNAAPEEGGTATIRAVPQDDALDESGDALFK